jgi:MFS family permease
MEHRSTYAPFRNPTFRNLWSATLASNLGGLIQAVGAGWLMTSLTTQHSLVALVQASNTLPIMLFSLIAGALADSFNRRRILLVAQVFMLVVSALLAAFAWQGSLTPWTLLGFTFLIGCGTALYNPAWQASMGDIVGRADLPNAVSLNSMGFNMMRSVGPAIGGFIVAAAGAAMAFAANALSYVPLILALLVWRPVYPEENLPREPLHRALGAGLRYVAMSPALIRVMTRGALFGFAACAVLALMPTLARDVLRGTAVTYGVMLGAFGFGAIIGAALNGRLRARLGNESIVQGASVAFAAGLIALGFSKFLIFSLVALLACGVAWVMTLSLFNVSVQLATPRWVVGRALSFYQMATFGGMATGSWVWGVLADGWGTDRALIAAGVVLGIGVLIGRWLPMADFSDLDLDPSGRFTEPALRLELRHRSGPIMVMIDYRIAQEDVGAFLAAMQDRRRIRRRDGARQWALLRNLENPEQWTESYHVPTWVDYIRHQQRRTKADLDVSERLLALHRGPGQPTVHRMIERQTVPLRDDMPLKPLPEVP